jgi:Na+-driven multidrug efflux pump
MMWPRLKKSLLSRLRLKESWVIFFILGIIMMNYPFINIFNKPDRLFGMPALYFYLQFGWLISILVIVIFTKSIDHKDDSDKE